VPAIVGKGIPVIWHRPNVQGEMGGVLAGVHRLSSGAFEQPSAESKAETRRK
jgi:hypothetical protein